MSFLCAVWTLLTDWMDPVCQDVNAVMYGESNGDVVRLVPIVHDGRVARWIPDPAEVRELEQLDRLAGIAPAPAPALPPPLPSGTAAPPFNPAGVPGI